MEVVISRGRGAKTYHDPMAGCPYARHIKKENRIQVSENKAKNKGYCGCRLCTGLGGLAYKYKKRGFDCLYDSVSNSVCMKTDVGFWKAIWYDDEQKFHLFHMNGHGYKCFKHDLPSNVLVAGKFHRQADVLPTSHFGNILKYILDHDKNKRIIMNDGIQKMPKNTAKQRKYYKQAKKRKRKNDLRRLDRIFKQLESENNK